MSINQSNEQSVATDIAQETTQRCSVACSATSNIHIVATDSTIGNISSTTSCITNDSSCALTSCLQSSIINNLKDQQKSLQMDVPGLFSVLSQLAGGNNQDINQTSSQQISNQATQLTNSLCQNNTVVTKNVDFVLHNDTVNNIDLNALGESNKFQCVIKNMSKFTAQNNESNSQSATQLRISGLIFIIMIIVIGVVAVAIFKYGFSKKGDKKAPTINVTEENKAPQLTESETATETQRHGYNTYPDTGHVEYNKAFSKNILRTK